MPKEPEDFLGFSYGFRLGRGQHDALDALYIGIKSQRVNWILDDHFSRWNKRGVWETALDQINGLHRQAQGRSASPSYGIIDSQSIKTEYASEERGIDGGKKVKGRKRHIVVDVLGNLLHVSVHAANRSDTVAACPVMARAAEKHPSVQAFSDDATAECSLATYLPPEPCGVMEYEPLPSWCHADVTLVFAATGRLASNPPNFRCLNPSASAIF